MTENNKNITLENQNNDQDTVFNPGDDLQIIMQGGLPVSVIVPMEEFDRMNVTIALAQELLDGKDLFLPDGTKVTFEEMAEQRVAADRAEYEAELAMMLADEYEDEDCDEDCGEECEKDEQN